MFVINLQVKSKTNEGIQILHELIQFNSGLSQNLCEISINTRYWSATWLDNVYERLSTRKMQVTIYFWTF